MMPPFMQDDQPFVGMGDLFIGVDAALQRYDLIRISMQEQDRTVHAGDAVTAVADDLHERRIKALWYADRILLSIRVKQHPGPFAQIVCGLGHIQIGEGRSDEHELFDRIERCQIAGDDTAHRKAEQIERTALREDLFHLRPGTVQPLSGITVPFIEQIVEIELNDVKMLFLRPVHQIVHLMAAPAAIAVDRQDDRPFRQL